MSPSMIFNPFLKTWEVKPDESYKVCSYEHKVRFGNRENCMKTRYVIFSEPEYF